MLRIIVGVIVGYLVAVVVVLIGLGIQWSILRGPGAFEPGTNVASLSWSLGALVGALIAGIAGGVVASVIGRTRGWTAARALAAIFFIAGIALAILAMVQGKPVTEGVPADYSTLTFAQAGEIAQSPTWYNFAVAVVGAVGALIGGSLRKSRATTG